MELETTKNEGVAVFAILLSFFSCCRTFLWVAHSNHLIHIPLHEYIITSTFLFRPRFKRKKSLLNNKERMEKKNEHT